MAYTVSGITRNRVDSSPLPAAAVYLLKFNSGTDTFTQVDSGVSNGSGAYSLDAADGDAAYAVLAFDDDGAPVLTGVTRRDLTPGLTPSGDSLALFDDGGPTLLNLGML